MKMTSTADIKDTTQRDTLEQVERWIDDGEYAKAARVCADIYMDLLARHPELIPPANLRPGLPGLQSGENAAAYDQHRLIRRAFWPITGGIRVVVNEAGKPELVFDKERFSLSEALTYFEFTVEQVAKHQ
jgi:hypothetical protein